MGAIGEPKISIDLRAESSKGSLALIAQKALIPDLIKGVLASPFASIPVRNEGQNAIQILEIMADVVSPFTIRRI